ncbi:hypothetical protein VTK73DRAFT_9810 [Phialemonium thermophilum]|uniref:Histone deacetylase complex subunit SAP18 n=1 Tax=Phialemonium thermophilum TaxID=223376 RepID=A0ABR3XJG2_9PEZI
MKPNQAMEASSDQLDRTATTPFLLKLFYRTGAFHRPEEFTSASHLPPHLSIYAWPSTTLSELSHHLAAANPPILPDPAVGTRLAFRLLYPDARGAGPRGQGRYVIKDLGSLVIGEGGPGAAEHPSDDNAEEQEQEEGGNRRANSASTSYENGDAHPPGLAAAAVAESSASRKTLAEAKLVVGDYVSCAILPPVAATGAVSPASAARTGRGSGVGEAPPAPPTPVASSRFGVGREGGAWGRGRGGRGGRGVGHFGDRDRTNDWDRDRLRDRERDDDFGPSGEWRRGERLPDGPPSRPRGRGPRW